MAHYGWSYVKPIVMQALGYTFLVLGVLGLFLPILQGFLFLFIGLLILARHAAWAQRLLDAVRARYPRADHMIGEAERRWHAWSWRTRARLRVARGRFWARLRCCNPWAT